MWYSSIYSIPTIFQPPVGSTKKVTGAAVNKYILFLDRCHAKNCNSSQSLKVLNETLIALVFEIGTGSVQKLGICIGERVSCRLHLPS
jgi:hypothetical protein